MNSPTGLLDPESPSTPVLIQVGDVSGLVEGVYPVTLSIRSFSAPSGVEIPVDLHIQSAEPGTTELIDISMDGGLGNAASEYPSVSGDGLLVAFESLASNLVPSDTNSVRDIFVRDRLGAETRRVSQSSTGVQGNSASSAPSLSADGRYVAFESTASNLVVGDTNGARDIFVHDRQTGGTERVSESSAGGQGNNASLRPSISANGRFVAFASEASNLVSGDTNGWRDVFVHDRATGQTARVSISSSGEQANGLSDAPCVSENGRYVAFGSGAANLVPADTNGFADVFVHDRQNGQTERVSVSTSGSQGNGASGRPAVSANGRHVAFDTEASSFGADGGPSSRVYVHDRETAQTQLVNGWGQRAEDASISSSGEHLVFQARTLSAFHLLSIHRLDTQTNTTGPMSVSTSGTAADRDSVAASISGDGRHVAFHSGATNLVGGDFPLDTHHVYLRSIDAPQNLNAGEETEPIRLTYRPDVDPQLPLLRRVKPPEGGPGTMRWRAELDPRSPWLELDSAHGWIECGESLILSVFPQGLPEGLHRGTVRLGEFASGDSVVVPVELTVETAGAGSDSQDDIDRNLPEQARPRR